MPSTAEQGRIDVERALEVLAGGELVAFPTETVWGLAARAESEESLGRLRAFKGRDAGKPVSVLVDSAERLEALGVTPSTAARELVRAFWPGPLTLVLGCTHRFAEGVAGKGGSVGFRCSTHPVAAALARGAFERGVGPVTATSLNRSGEAPARTAAEALAVVGGRVPVTVGEAGAGSPSTVVDATGDVPRILREGAIPASVVLEPRARARAEAASR